VTERDVARVEKQLGVQLPGHYRHFLIHHGAAIAKARRNEIFVPFFTTAKEIIDANKDLRVNPSLRDTNHDTEPWPLKYLIVGTNGGGDDWCVDLTDEREVIWLFESEAYGTFRHAEPSTWAGYLEELRSPKPVESRPLRFFTCKKGSPGPDAVGDGSFTVKDDRGRGWVCYEQKVPTEEELLARVRGELRAPAWLHENGLHEVGVANVEKLRAALAKVR
jgi:hypothetical protein